MIKELLSKEKSIAIVGLGYVGLPIALALARKFRVIGFDTNSSKIEMLHDRNDPSMEVDSSTFNDRDIHFTSVSADIHEASFFIIAVPTDVDAAKQPNLSPLQNASVVVGAALSPGDYVVYESTVYPGCTEEVCVPLLESTSGFTLGADFKVGYSPERIVPGDSTRTLIDVIKIVSGSDDEALDVIARLYEEIVGAGVYRAPSIKVAEAAKIVENVQRDLNISLMNELAIIFDKMGIKTNDVLAAAGTKWNFHHYHPGLVGGHCIAVDPYYLLHKAMQLGYNPEVILSGRKVNDYMPTWIAKKLIQMLTKKGKNPRYCRVLVLGIAFKENVSDIRNSKVATLVHELQSMLMSVDVLDPYVFAGDVQTEYGINLVTDVSGRYDAIIAAVPHDGFKTASNDFFLSMLTDNGILMDLKSIYKDVDPRILHWTL